MSIAEISHKVELHFWNWAIPTLSLCPKAQKFVRYAYRVVKIATGLRWYWLSILVTAFGFINGLLVFQIFAR